MKTWSDWHHSPSHRFSEQGTFFVTAGTYLKEHYFRRTDDLDFLTETLLTYAAKFEWQIHSFAVFSNHYHFVGFSEQPQKLPKLVQAVHSIASIYANKRDGIEGRKIWYQYRDTKLTTAISYYSRFRYVQENPVHHRLVRAAENYPWCSAAGFKVRATLSEYNRLMSFPIDDLRIDDEFEPCKVDSLV